MTGRYRPTLAEAEVARLRVWHENAYRAGRAEGGAVQTFDYLGRVIVVPPDVFPVTPVSHLLGEAVLAEVRPGERVLDMGTGSGVVDGHFDLIVFDPPFRWFAARDDFERAMADEDYRALTTFFRTAAGHLTPDGRMLIFFGTSGDLGYLQRLIAEAGFASETVAHGETLKDGIRVDYFTFRLTR